MEGKEGKEAIKLDYYYPRKVQANCETCGKYWEGVNAQAVGAIHARKYGHRVFVEVYQCIVYGAEKRRCDYGVL